MFEYFTIGGGWFLFNFFSAVSAIAQSSAYGYVMQSALLLSSGWVLFMLAFQAGRWNILTNWAAVSIIVVSTLMVPSATVKVTDRINTVDSAGYIISDVPYGLALFSSLTSQIGDGLTSLFEDNFADVNSPSLQQHGFLFGVKLLAASTQIEIQDANFESTLSSFIRNCTFYDILQGRKSFQTLQTSADPWAYISSDPARARMFEYARTSGSGTDKTITTCAAGIADLNLQWIAETELAATRLALSISSNRGNQNDQVVRALVQTELSSFHEYLIGASRSSADILKRQMTINALLREPANWMAERGNDAALTNYIDARLQLQTRESYKSIGRQAERWVANLKAVFQCIYIGIFPIAALLMLSPMGATIFKNYVFGLVWIESWGALFALLNYIMNSTARQEMLAAVKAASTASGDITLLAQAGIQSVESDISVMAGYLSMSVPFISLALVAGAGRFAYLATSTLAVSQEAVASTTQEAVTGNLSAGNTQYDNHSFHNYSGFNRNTSPHWNSGQSSAIGDDGSLHTETAGGEQIVNQSGAGSNTLSKVNVAGQVSSVAGQNFSDSTNAATTAGINASNSRTAADNDLTTFSSNVNSGSSAAFNYNTEDRAQLNNDLSNVQRAGQSLSNKTGESVNDSTKAIVQASTGFKVFGIGGQARAEYDASNSTSISYDQALEAGQSTSVSESLSRLSSASSSTSTGQTYSDGNSFSESYSANLTEARTQTESRDASLTEAQRYETILNAAQNNSAGFNQDYNQAFFNHVQEQEGIRGHNSADLAGKLFSSTDPADQQTVRSYAQSFVDKIASGHVEGVNTPNFNEINADQRAAVGNFNNPGTSHTATSADVPTLTPIAPEIGANNQGLVDNQLGSTGDDIAAGGAKVAVGGDTLTEPNDPDEFQSRTEAAARLASSFSNPDAEQYEGYYNQPGTDNNVSNNTDENSIPSKQGQQPSGQSYKGWVGG
ncbi:MAG: conjugal transfer protein TraG N-terminal domain-containing protein [Candidatus Puniceispirillales bacterium WSBS_2018_MAG_OTU23]